MGEPFVPRARSVSAHPRSTEVVVHVIADKALVEQDAIAQLKSLALKLPNVISA
jgi:hypothetical protein